MLVDKFLMLLATILANAKHHGIGGTKLVDQCGKFVRLDGATRRVILGIKIEDNVFVTAVLCQADVFPGLIDRSEVRCGLFLFEHGGYPFSLKSES